jgi:hypothetical protein
MAKRTLPKWKMSALTAEFASATDMILEENWQIQKNIRKKETTKNEEILSTSTTASTSAFIIYHQSKNEET